MLWTRGSSQLPSRLVQLDLSVTQQAAHHGGCRDVFFKGRTCGSKNWFEGNTSEKSCFFTFKKNLDISLNQKSFKPVDLKDLSVGSLAVSLTSLQTLHSCKRSGRPRKDWWIFLGAELSSFTWIYIKETIQKKCRTFHVRDLYSNLFRSALKHLGLAWACAKCIKIWRWVKKLISCLQMYWLLWDGMM